MTTVILHSPRALNATPVRVTYLFAEKSNDKVSIRTYVNDERKISLAYLSPDEARWLADKLLRVAEEVEERESWRRAVN